MEGLGTAGATRWDLMTCLRLSILRAIVGDELASGVTIVVEEVEVR